MCGILAVISKTSDLDKAKFDLALSRSKHRGPNGSRITRVNSSCLFGFNRLAILDLSEDSMQPFQFGENWIVFNGEIYNYLELKEELSKKGVTFTTNGDTEVLIAGLATEGISFLNKLNGIYGFVFYDAQKQTYLAARDRMGIKPLFYYHGDDKLVFSSEIKSILDYVPPRVNLQTLYSHIYLDWFIGYRQKETFFDGIHSLSSGEYHLYDQNGKLLESKKYYEPNFQTTNTNFNQIEKDFPKLVDDVFELETSSDANVGVIMSGGIDTSTILTLATPHLAKRQKKIPVFTFFYDKKGEKTDLEFTRKILAHLRQSYGDIFDAHEYNMDEAITLDDFKAATLARETPVFDIRYIILTRLYRELGKLDMKVSLSGQGSDEVYYGYYSLDYWLSKFFRKGVLNVPNVLDYYRDELNKNKQPLLNQDFLKDARESSEKHLGVIFEKLPLNEKQPKVLTALFRQTILPSFMLYEDKFGMSSGIEVRVPLINHVLVDYIDQCDYEVNLVSSNAGRHLFRQILKDKLPEEIVMRGKTPTPKKRNYVEELENIIAENSDSILESDLLNVIYDKDFLKKICQTKKQNFESSDNSQPFYGGTEDILLELIGLYAFEQVYLRG